LLHVVDQPVLCPQPEEFTPRDAVGDPGADIHFQPTLDKLPAKFISEFEMLNHTCLDRIAGDFVPVGS